MAHDFLNMHVAFVVIVHKQFTNELTIIIVSNDVFIPH